MHYTHSFLQSMQKYTTYCKEVKRFRRYYSFEEHTLRITQHTLRITPTNEWEGWGLMGQCNISAEISVCKYVIERPWLLSAETNVFSTVQLTMFMRSALYELYCSAGRILVRLTNSKALPCDFQPNLLVELVALWRICKFWTKKE